MFQNVSFFTFKICGQLVNAIFSSDEFMIMVEYCSFGNVRDFLKNYKYEFIDDVDPITGSTNCNIRQSTLKTHRFVTYNPYNGNTSLMFCKFFEACYQRLIFSAGLFKLQEGWSSCHQSE